MVRRVQSDTLKCFTPSHALHSSVREMVLVSIDGLKLTPLRCHLLPRFSLLGDQTHVFVMYSNGDLFPLALPATDVSGAGAVVTNDDTDSILFDEEEDEENEESEEDEAETGQGDGDTDDWQRGSSAQQADERRPTVETEQ